MAYPTRVEPRADGKAQNPPSGGSWLRDEDGGLTPADEATAALWHAAYGHVAEPEPEPGPDLHVRFQLNAGGAAGANTFVDEAGNSTINVTGAVAYASDVKFAGRNAIALNLGHLSIDPSSLLDFSGLSAATVEFYWYREPSSGSSQLLTTASTGGPMGGLFLGITPDHHAYLYCREYQVFNPIPDISSGPDSAWHHVAAVFARTDSPYSGSYLATLYFDGNQVAEATVFDIRGVSGSNIAFIGEDCYGNSCPDRIGGVRISEMAVYTANFTPDFQPFPPLPSLG